MLPKRRRKPHWKRPSVETFVLWRKVWEEGGGGLMPATQAARILGITRQAFNSRINAGKINAIKFDRDNCRYVRVRDILAQVDTATAAAYFGTGAESLKTATGG